MEPVHISNVLTELLDRIDVGREFKGTKLLSKWNTIVGNVIAKRTRPVSLYRGILTVEVTDSVWLTELDRFHKENILRKIKDECNDLEIKDIRFKIGMVS